MSEKSLPTYRKRIIIDLDANGVPTVVFKYHPEEEVPVTPRELNFSSRALQVQHKVHLQARVLNLSEAQLASAKGG